MRALPDLRTLAIRNSIHAAAFAIVVAIAGAASPALAVKGDSEAPTQVESDRMQYDDLKQINVFTGNVVLTKGTIRLTADRLVVRQDPEGYQYATATGSLAEFRQKRDGPGEQYVEGHAQQIDYDGKLETVHLQRQAMLRRTENARVVDEVYGSDILYEARSEFFTVEGARGQAVSPGNPGGRVRVVIQPRDDRSAAPAAPAGSGAPTPLKPADRIEAPREGGPR